MIPDAERLLGDYLRDEVDVKVGGRMPASTRQPFIRLTQLDAQDVGGQEHLIDFLIQLDCYAGADAMDAFIGQAEAVTVARNTRAALHALRGATLSGVTVTEVVFTSMTRLPDGDFEPERERVVLDASVFMHP